MTDIAPARADTVNVTINGTAIDAPKGELVIETAERAGVHIPRFCYHPRMKPVGMCRMCIVDIDTGRGPALQPSCMITVADGMVVETESPGTKKAQDGVLEFLLVNHPLDCPVCDKGGECPLQDNAYAFGPGESRFVEEKRHFEKPIPVSDLVLLDRERCILCDRCTRFAKDVAGDPLIHFLERGNQTEVNTFPDHPFASYFSGNTVQICPVGALTATPYRFKARPWDVEKAESTCTSCAVGCRISVESSRNHVLRRSGVDIDPVNWGWLCDKGRFDYEAGESEARLTGPLLRPGGQLTAASWNDALRAAAEALRAGLDTSGADHVGVLGGARLTNESAYAWAKLVKGVLGTDNVDCQLGDGLPPEVVLGLPRATIDDACAGGATVLLVAPDLKQELPVLFLRLRDAVLNRGVTVVELAPADTSVSALAAASVRYRPGEAGAVARTLVGLGGGVDPLGGDLDAAREALQAAGERLVVVLGRPSVAESAATLVDAAAAVHEAVPAARFLGALRRANVRGALDMGLAPGLLPGHVSLDDGRGWFTGGGWDRVPPATGLDALGILTAAAEGRVTTLVLLGADPLADFPDHDLARRALERAEHVIAVDTHRNASVEAASIVLAAAGPGEVSGTTTNLEGRVSTLAQKVTPPGTARADWQIAAELAWRLGRDLGVESVSGIWAEIERLAPSHARLTPELVAWAGSRDGLLAPIDPAQLASLDGAVVSINGSAAAAGAEPALDAADAEPEVTDAPTEPGGPAAPPLLTFRALVPTELPAVDAYGLRLVATRTLYDEGTLVANARSLRGLAADATVRMNPGDLARLGLGDVATVAISSARGRATLETVADPGVPAGSVAMHVNHRGADPASLIDATEVATKVQVETVVAEAAG